MPKKRERTETEYLKGIIRQQKAQIRHLKKELKRTSRDTEHYHELQDALSEEIVPALSGPSDTEECKECGRGVLSRETLGVRILVKCSDCGYSKFEKST